ncbi:MAG: M24 family metallopeptidase [Alphaproteobacteria bacterium]|nr:M24 family metallopeptidase [Alphaproteobacteria bacterium]
MANIKRLGAMLAEMDADWAVLTGADSVCFATGHVVPIEIGQSPFSGGPTVAFVGRDGSAGVVCPNTDGGQGGDYEEIAYAGFANAVTDQVGNYRASVSELITRIGLSGSVAIETSSFPRALSDLLPDDMRPMDVPLARLRAVKNEDEVTHMAFAAKVAAAGQNEARRLSVPGACEMDNFGRIRSKMEVMSNARCALAGEYITGVDRTSQLGLPISDRIIEAGDPVVCDLAPRVAGYWGDSCSAFVVGGEPTAEYERMYDAAKNTLELAIAELRPGLRVCDFDAKLRAHMKGLGYEYPHHSGHGIGTSVHEFPRLVPDETALFEENMFIMVEPGSYVRGLGGLRCEFMLRVTATGAEVTAPFEMTCK